MKNLVVTALASILPIVAGCRIPDIMLPTRLYDLKEGRTIDIVLHQTSRDHGIIESPHRSRFDEVTERFEGEYVLFDYFQNPIIQPIGILRNFEKSEDGPEPLNLAELYGFSKYSDARPVGTGIMVGSNGRVVEIVFYRVSPDRRTGDGVARDNKGRSYRIFLSEEASRSVP